MKVLLQSGVGMLVRYGTAGARTSHGGSGCGNGVVVIKGAAGKVFMVTGDGVGLNGENSLALAFILEGDILELTLFTLPRWGVCSELSVLEATDDVEVLMLGAGSGLVSMGAGANMVKLAAAG